MKSKKSVLLGLALIALLFSCESFISGGEDPKPNPKMEMYNNSVTMQSCCGNEEDPDGEPIGK